MKSLVGSVCVESSVGGYSGEPVPKNGRVHCSLPLLSLVSISCHIWPLPRLCSCRTVLMLIKHLSLNLSESVWEL